MVGGTFFDIVTFDQFPGLWVIDQTSPILSFLHRLFDFPAFNTGCTFHRLFARHLFTATATHNELTVATGIGSAEHLDFSRTIRFLTDPDFAFFEIHNTPPSWNTALRLPRVLTEIPSNDSLKLKLRSAGLTLWSRVSRG
jgi:hypothetical protein